MTKPKKFIVTRGQRMEMQSLANLTGIPEQVVSDAYVKSFVTGMKPFDILQPYMAEYEANKEGREFTPVFWYRTDDGVTHLTLWDMNEQPDYGLRIKHAWNTRPKP